MCFDTLVAYEKSRGVLSGLSVLVYLALVKLSTCQENAGYCQECRGVG